MATDLRTTQLLLIGALAAGFLTAVTLLFPWFRLGSRSRSSIELIGSLGALDVIEGGVKFFVVLAWFVVPLLVAVAMLTAASGRLRLSAVLLLPLGPLLLLTLIVVLVAASDVLAWGAYLAMACALIATGSALLVMVRLGRRT